MSFVPQSFLEQLPGASRALVDAQSFGVVQVDDDGTVRLYNRWESELAGVPVPSAEGRNFFTQVAPCTNNRLVLGKFRDGVAKGELDSQFNYTFTYKMKPTNVTLRLYRDPASGSNWVFIGRR